MSESFKFKAKLHQAEFKKEVLKIDEMGCIPMNVTNKETKQAEIRNVCMPHFLSEKDARDGLMYFQPYRSEILQCIDEELNGFNHLRDGNMLRSEHIPLNIFVPMRNELEQTKKLMNFFLKEDSVRSVDRIHFKTSGNFGDEMYLNDKTTFDVRIDFTHQDGEKGCFGVDVKYTEGSFLMSETERMNIFENKDNRYYQISKFSEYYQTNNLEELIKEHLSKDNLRPIWRSHLLGASMIKSGEINHFYCLYLYPAENEPFQKYIPEYQQFLSEKGKKTFIPITFEDFFAGMKGIFNENDTQKDWVNYLTNRYLV